MNVKQAAECIGCHPRYVRTLIANGKLRARLRKVNGLSIRFWDVDYRSVRAYSRRPQVGGWPRGVSRN